MVNDLIGHSSADEDPMLDKLATAATASSVNGIRIGPLTGYTSTKITGS